MVDARCAAAQSAAPAHGVRIGGIVRAGIGTQVGALPVNSCRQPRQCLALGGQPLPNAVQPLRSRWRQWCRGQPGKAAGENCRGLAQRFAAGRQRQRVGREQMGRNSVQLPLYGGKGLFLVTVSGRGTQTSP